MNKLGNFLPHTHSDDEQQIDMTPMLDIVFIMLIFFIVTASFVTESGVEINRPEAATSVKQDNQGIMLAITRDNKIWINQKQVDPRAVRRTIERLTFENPSSSVVIQADEKSDTGMLIRAMDQVKLAGVSNVAIAASPVN